MTDKRKYIIEDLPKKCHESLNLIIATQILLSGDCSYYISKTDYTWKMYIDRFPFDIFIPFRCDDMSPPYIKISNHYINRWIADITKFAEDLKDQNIIVHQIKANPYLNVEGIWHLTSIEDEGMYKIYSLWLKHLKKLKVDE